MMFLEIKYDISCFVIFFNVLYFDAPFSLELFVNCFYIFYINCNRPIQFNSNFSRVKADFDFCNLLCLLHTLYLVQNMLWSSTIPHCKSSLGKIHVLTAYLSHYFHPTKDYSYSTLIYYVGNLDVRFVLSITLLALRSLR